MARALWWILCACFAAVGCAAPDLPPLADDTTCSIPEESWFDASANFQEILPYASAWSGSRSLHVLDCLGYSGKIARQWTKEGFVSSQYDIKLNHEHDVVSRAGYFALLDFALSAIRWSFTAAVEPLRQGLAVQEQLLLRACCSASREGVSGTFVFWEEALSNRQARHAKRGALLHWADYKRWFQHTVMESQKLRLRRLFWALRPVSQPQEHRDLRDRLALRNAQRTAQRCLRELHVRFLRQRKALRARQLQLQRQCFTAMAQWQLLRYAFQCLAGRSDTPRALPEFSDVLLVKAMDL